MRIVVLGLLMVLVAGGSTLAQGYEYTTSGLEYQSTVPVEAGSDVQGLLRLETGMTALGQVHVEGVYYDDLFAYWVGTFNSREYYYDIYDGYWKPGPVSYHYATLDFQEQIIEGWARQFGPYLDSDHFFGRDGVLYQRIKVVRGRTRGTSRTRRVVYSYFVNMATGERSDSEGLPYLVIGDEEVARELIEEVMLDSEAVLEQLVVDDPAYPEWEATAFAPPAEVAAPGTINVGDETNLLQLIEGEIGPLTVEEEPAAEEEASAATGNGEDQGA